jgi:hypothetical protein
MIRYTSISQVVFFIMAATCMSTSLMHAQVFERMEIQDGISTQVYSASVVVDLPTQSSDHLAKATEARSRTYEVLRKSVMELAAVRIENETKIQTNEYSTRKANAKAGYGKRYNLTEEEFENSIRTTSRIEVSIKPLKEIKQDGQLLTQIELWVKSILPLPGTAEYAAPVNHLLEKDALFNHLGARSGQKYLITFNRSVIFDEGHNLVMLTAEYASRMGVDFMSCEEGYVAVRNYSRSDLMIPRLIRYSSSDLLEFPAGTFIAELELKDRFINTYLSGTKTDCPFLHLRFTRGGETFALRFAVFWDQNNDYKKSVSDFIKCLYFPDKSLETEIVITPAFEFKPRVLGN